jgi:hypothetical protein
MPLLRAEGETKQKTVRMKNRGRSAMETTGTQTEQLERLERFVRTTKALALLGLVSLMGLFVVEKYVSASTSNEKILRVRGIVIEDATGHPRLLLGSPISNQGRKRQDELTGLVLLGEDGTDRLTIGTAADVQINGKMEQRIAKGVGILLNDITGNERGGFGFLDNGRVTLGLDRAHGEEGAFLTVRDEDGFAGVVIKDVGSCVVTSFGNSKENGTRLLLRDRACADRISLGMSDSITPKLEVRDGQEKLVFDAFAAPH